MKIEFVSDNKKLLDMLNELDRKVRPAAIGKSLNRTAVHVIAESARAVAKQTGLPQKHFKKRIYRKVKASTRSPLVRIWAGLWDIPVKRFSDPRELKSGGVKYKTIGGAVTDRNAFMTPVTGNSVMKRKGRDRLPLKQITAPIGPIIEIRLWTILRSPETRAYYEKTFFHDMNYRIESSMRRKGLTVK